MPRVTSSVPSRRRRKKVLKSARGFYGATSKRIRVAYDAVDKANSYRFIGRKQKKREYRRLWTVRINIACRSLGTNYSSFIDGLKKANICINRKMLADLAVKEPETFRELVSKAGKAVAPETAAAAN